MAAYDMPADDTALLDLLLERAERFWSFFWSGDHEFILAALQRKKRRVVELRRSIDIRLRNVNLSAKSYKFFPSACNWNKKLWNGFEKKKSCIWLLSSTSQPRYSNVIQRFWTVLNENPINYREINVTDHLSIILKLIIIFYYIIKFVIIFVTSKKMSLILKRVVPIFYKLQ